jgi:GT2 family glycosyltransferase
MISLLVVNYRSVDLAIEAIRSARSSNAGRLQVVVVDNSVDSSEGERLRPHCDELLLSPSNVGYAAAINAGRRKCDGSAIVVSNPDVVFQDGAIATLAAALEDETVGVAGPALYWDDRNEWILPPSDLHTAADKLDEALATRSLVWFRWRDRRRVQRRMDFWALDTTTAVKAISGAVMAIDAHVFDSVGGFDERFRLYFEENDFLRRVAAKGKRIVYVPAARCRHLYNQSAGQSAEATAFYAQSERSYLEKWYGSFTARLLSHAVRELRLPEPPRLESAFPITERDVLMEASPLRTFVTAAGHVADDRSSINVPDEVWRSFRGSVLYLRALRRSDARVLGTWARYK